MLPRAAILALSVCALACSEPAHKQTTAPPFFPIASSTPTASRAVSLTRPVLDRPSELAPVTDDVPDPEAQRQFQARIAQPAIPLAPAKEPPRVTAIALDDTRRGEAPGMTPAGDIFTATLAEGQRATMPIKIAPTDCETIIAQGGLGVIEVDLFLTGGDGAKGRILKEDPGTGPIAVIGGHGECVKGAAGTGTEGTLHAAVRRGAGVVLVRVYKR